MLDDLETIEVLQGLCPNAVGMQCCSHLLNNTGTQLDSEKVDTFMKELFHDPGTQYECQRLLEEGRRVLAFQGTLPPVGWHFRGIADRHAQLVGDVEVDHDRQLYE